MRKIIYAIILITLIPLGSLLAQKISDVNAYIHGDTIFIDYTITGVKYNQSLNVKLYVSNDKGVTFLGPLKEVSGDVGKGIKNGNNKIIWDVVMEMPFTDEELIFDVRAKVIQYLFFVSYVGNNITPIGLKFGMLGKFGWYIEGRLSFDPFKKYTYIYNKSGFMENYPNYKYYEFTGYDSYSAFSVCAGFTLQASRSAFFYFGAGYGKHLRLLEINEWDYGGHYWGKFKVKYENDSYIGIETNAGLILKFNNFIINGGSTTIDFQTFNWTAGIGISF